MHLGQSLEGGIRTSVISHGIWKIWFTDKEAWNTRWKHSVWIPVRQAYFKHRFQQWQVLKKCQICLLLWLFCCICRCFSAILSRVCAAQRWVRGRGWPGAMQPRVHGLVNSFILRGYMPIVIRICNLVGVLLIRHDAHHDMTFCLQTPEKSSRCLAPVRIRSLFISVKFHKVIFCLAGDWVCHRDFHSYSCEVQRCTCSSLCRRRVLPASLFLCLSHPHTWSADRDTEDLAPNMKGGILAASTTTYLYIHYRG